MEGIKTAEDTCHRIYFAVTLAETWIWMLSSHWSNSKADMVPDLLHMSYRDRGRNMGHFLFCPLKSSVGFILIKVFADLCRV